MKNYKKVKISLISSICSLFLISSIAISSNFATKNITTVDNQIKNNMSTNSSYHTMVFAKDPNVAEDISFVGSTTITYRDSALFGSIAKPEVVSETPCLGWYYYDDTGTKQYLTDDSVLSFTKKTVIVYPHLLPLILRGYGNNFYGTINQSGECIYNPWFLYDYKTGVNIQEGEFDYWIHCDEGKTPSWLHCRPGSQTSPGYAIVCWDQIPPDTVKHFTFRIAYHYSVNNSKYGVVDHTFYSDLLSFGIDDGLVVGSYQTINISPGASGIDDIPCRLYINGESVQNNVQFSLVDKQGADGVSINNEGFVTWTKDATSGKFKVQATYNNQKYTTSDYITVDNQIYIETLWDEFIDPDRNYEIDTESNWELLIRAIDQGILKHDYDVVNAIEHSVLYLYLYGYNTFSWANTYYAGVKINNQLYTVRLIGLEQDVLSAQESSNEQNSSNSNIKHALMTWEFINYICDDDGQQLFFKWDPSLDPEGNYFKSTINELLNNEDNFMPQAKWLEYDWETGFVIRSTTYITSVYKMIEKGNPYLAHNIKTVDRTVNNSPSSRTDPTPVKLFLPTLANYLPPNQLAGEHIESCIGEGGTQYSYFMHRNINIYSGSECLYKKAIHSNLYMYWADNYYLGSKFIYDDSYVSGLYNFKVDNVGSINWYDDPTESDPACIAPCFCL